MYAQVYLVYPMFVPLARDTLCSRSYLGAVASLHITQGGGIPGWGCTVICQWYALMLPLPRSSDISKVTDMRVNIIMDHVAFSSMSE
jgi:hypothetical protein